MRISHLRRLFVGSRFFPDLPKSRSFPDVPTPLIPFGDFADHNHTPPDHIDHLRPSPVFTQHPKSLDTTSLPLIIKDDHLAYRDSLKDLVNFEKGMVFDADYVLSMLPTDTQVACRESKYLMVCFNVRLLEFDERLAPPSMTDLISVASELKEMYGSDFEMVLVARKKPNSSKYLNSYLYSYPDFFNVVTCLEKIEDTICPEYLVLERNFQSTKSKYTYKVLQRREFYDFQYYGADLFPYTDEIIQDLSQFIRVDKLKCPIQLDQLFGSMSSELRVFKGSVGGKESMLLSDLQGKLMWLYLRKDGSLMRKLEKTCVQCIEKGLEFEIVVVDMSVKDYLDQGNLRDLLKLEVSKLSKSDTPAKTCWHLPFIDSIYRRFLRTCPRRTDELVSDKLIVVGPNGEFVDPFAGELLRKYGVTAYPFSRKHYIECLFDQVRSHTLDSFLVYGDRDYVHEEDRRYSGMYNVPVSKLHGKIILLHFAPEPSILVLLRHFLDRLKRVHPSLEVVFIYSKKPETELNNTEFNWPCLVCPYEHEHSANVAKLLGSDIDQPAMIAFGEDGRICSIEALELLMFKGVDSFPYKANLRQEIVQRLLDAANTRVRDGYYQRYTEELILSWKEFKVDNEDLDEVVQLTDVQLNKL